jgi:hypothetical protein
MLDPSAQTQPSPKDDNQNTPELLRFLHRLPTAMAQRLSETERAAYAKALAPQRAPHWIDLKASIPIPGFGIYVALMIGRERRNRQRLGLEGQIRFTPNLIIAAILLSTVVAGWLAAVTLIKGLALMAGNNQDVWWRAYTGLP